MQITDRRGFFKSASVAALAVPAMASAGSAETPVLRVFREWHAHFEWEQGQECAEMDEGEFDAASDARIAIERRLFAMPCQNSTDVLAKLVAFTDNGGCFDGDGNWDAVILAEAKAAVVGVMV